MTAGLALVVPLVLGTVGRLVMAPRGEGQRPAAAAGHRAHGARKPTRHGKAAARVQIVERIVQPRRVAPKRPPLELPPANEIVREQPAPEPVRAVKTASAPLPAPRPSAASSPRAARKRAAPIVLTAPPATPKATLPKEGEAVDADGAFTAPEPEDQPQARYPEDAAAEGVTGSVRLKVIVGRRGEVQDAKVVHSSGDERLDRAAEAAVRRWRYRPAHRAGRPVPAAYSVRVEFYQDDEAKSEE